MARIPDIHHDCIRAMAHQRTVRVYWFSTSRGGVLTPKRCTADNWRSECSPGLVNVFAKEERSELRLASFPSKAGASPQWKYRKDAAVSWDSSRGTLRALLEVSG